MKFATLFLLLLANASLHGQEPQMRYAIVVHGGAGSPPSATDAARNFAKYDVRKQDRKSTRLNSSPNPISYAVFCLKQKSAPLTSIPC